jgi:hypothetical protein
MCAGKFRNLEICYKEFNVIFTDLRERLTSIEGDLHVALSTIRPTIIKNMQNPSIASMT